MRKGIWLIIAIIIFALILVYVNSPKIPVDETGDLNVPTMKITSPAFKNQELIPAKYTCDGENINPPLEISDIPPGAQSLALIMDDPDAPLRTWVHWLVWNINPEIKKISENSVPQGSVEGKTSFGKPGYGGPCPPSGTHRYFFKAYALDTLLDIVPNAGKAGLEKAMEGHILAKGELVGMYSRK